MLLPSALFKSGDVIAQWKCFPCRTRSKVRQVHETTCHKRRHGHGLQHSYIWGFSPGDDLPVIICRIGLCSRQSENRSRGAIMGMRSLLLNAAGLLFALTSFGAAQDYPTR